MAIALALSLVEAVAFIVANPAMEMLYLSARYAAATTDAQRALFLSAGGRCRLPSMAPLSTWVTISSASIS